MTEQEYTSRVVAKHGDKFKLDFSKYEGFTYGHIGVTCQQHGYTEYVPQAFLSSKYGCRHCSVEQRSLNKTQSWEALVEELEELYPGKYTYPECNRQTYVNRRSTIDVLCHKHGSFHKKAQKMLAGQACYLCKLDEGILAGKYPGGYGYDLFAKNPAIARTPATLYYLKLDNFYKIGITTTATADRVKALKSSAKREGGVVLRNVEIVQEVRTTLQSAYNTEQLLLDKFQSCRVARRWSTELFDRDILEETQLADLLVAT